MLICNYNKLSSINHYALHEFQHTLNMYEILHHTKYSKKFPGVSFVQNRIRRNESRWWVFDVYLLRQVISETNVWHSYTTGFPHLSWMKEFNNIYGCYPLKRSGLPWQLAPTYPRGIRAAIEALRASIMKFTQWGNIG